LGDVRSLMDVVGDGVEGVEQEVGLELTLECLQPGLVELTGGAFGNALLVDGPPVVADRLRDGEQKKIDREDEARSKGAREHHAGEKGRLGGGRANESEIGGRNATGFAGIFGSPMGEG